MDVAEKSLALTKGSSVTAAALEACASAVAFMNALSAVTAAATASLEQKAFVDTKLARKVELAELV